MMIKIHLTVQDIETAAATEQHCRDGLALYQKGGVYNQTMVKRGYRYQFTLNSFDDEERVERYPSAVFDLDGRLSTYFCTCEESQRVDGACVHVCGALFHILLEKKEEHHNRRRMLSAERILKLFEEVSANTAINTMPLDEKVTLLPVLSYTGHIDYYYDKTETTPSLSFKIGNARMYVVKNISDFLKAVSEKTVASYGKNLTFLHNLDNFDEKSQKLISFMKNCVNNINEYTTAYINSYYKNYTTGVKRSLHLSSIDFDIFFDMFKDERVESSVLGYGSNLLFTETVAPVCYNISENEQSVSISGANKYYIFYGGKYAYIIMGNSLHRADKNHAKIWKALDEEIREQGDLVFADKYLRKFLNIALPVLRKEKIADTEGVEKKFDICPLDKKVYLDAQDGAVTAKLLFCYGEKELNALSKGDDSGIVRNDADELNITKALTQFGFIPNKKKLWYILDNDEKIYNFYDTGIGYLRKISEVFATDDFTKKSQRVSMRKTSFGVRIEGRLLSVVPKSDYNINELLEIVDAYNHKKKFYKLKDGRFLNLENSAELSQTADFINNVGITKQDISRGELKVPSYKSLYFEQLMTDNAVFDKDETFKKLISDFENKNNIDFVVPKSLEEILRPYQKEGFKWLALMSRYNFGAILADDMGLGKTVQIISLILYTITQEHPKEQSLIVAPTSLIYNWEREFRKFAPKITAEVVAGTSQKRRQILNDSSSDVIITTYDMLKNDIEYYREQNYYYIVIDEAQNIKNADTQNSKAVKLLRANAKFALTGTPIENSLSELWSIFDFIMPAYLYNHAKFQREIESPIVRNDDKNAAARLKKMIAPFILRRLKRDVLTEIPEKQETNLYAEMTAEQLKVYTAYLKKAKGELDEILYKDTLKQNQLKVLSFITRLRQICCHPATFKEDYRGGSGKLDIVMETIKNCLDSGHRILLFSQFTSMLSILRGEFSRERVEYFYLDGATKAKDRNDMAERFNNGEKKVFLISLKAGGTGLNLVGADVVIHFDPWWNPAVMEQASDRAHRIGQTQVVQIFNVVAKDTIEEKIIELQEKKRGLVELVIDGNASFINKMSTEEIRNLFI
ncbi:helicase [Clostridia bacterium]|nr:helicase [Clostridia bacterium]